MPHSPCLALLLLNHAPSPTQPLYFVLRKRLSVSKSDYTGPRFFPCSFSRTVQRRQTTSPTCTNESRNKGWNDKTGANVAFFSSGYAFLSVVTHHAIHLSINKTIYTQIKKEDKSHKSGVVINSSSSSSSSSLPLS
jgi:hypothetical protein